MSVTYCLVTNGYTKHEEEARKAALFLLFDHREHFYEYTGKLPVDRPMSLTDPRMDGFYAAYSESAPIPKMREMGNFWMLAETMLQKVWNGEEAEQALYDLYIQCLLQLGKEDAGTQRITDTVPVDIRAELTGGD